MKTAKLLRAEEVAEMLGLRLPTVRRMIFERRVPTVKIGRSVRIPSEEIEKIINAGFRPKLESTSGGGVK